MEISPQLAQFTHQYQLQKTLRFELKPVPRNGESPAEALVRLKNSPFFKKDQDRENAYAAVKEIIDDFFRDFIDESLRKVKEDWSPLAEALEKKDEKTLEKVEGAYRKRIAESFGKTKDLLSKSLFVKFIPEWLDKKYAGEEKEEKSNKLNEFNGFSTYFSGFWENRENIFSDKEQHTAISFRIVNENFPKFYENAKAFIAAPEEVKKSLAKNFPDTDLAVVFSLASFNRFLTQEGIEFYNTLVGGVPAESGLERIQGFNELINEWRQHHPDEKPRRMNLLYKQILSDRGNSWADRLIQSDEELIEALKNLHANLFATDANNESPITTIKKLISELPRFDSEKIWITSKHIPAISLALFARWDALNPELKITNDEGESAGRSKLFSWREILDAIERSRENTEEFSSDTSDCQTLSSLFEFFQKIKTVENEQVCFTPILTFAKKAESMLASVIRQAEQVERLIGNEKLIAEIKSALDAVMEIFHKIKSLSAPQKLLREKKTDSDFYTELNLVITPMSSCAQTYDSVRNYLTKKPYSTEKMKLCFDHSTLANGWVESYTEKSDNGTQKGAYLFRKKNALGEYDYFLGVSKDSKLFSSRHAKTIPQEDYAEYERFDYYQPKSTSIFGSSYRGENSYAEDKRTLIEFMLEFSRTHGFEMALDVEDTTPNACIKNIQKEQPDIFEKLCKSSDFQEMNNALIENLKKTLATYDRAPRLKELCDKDFKLFSELIDEISLRATDKAFRFFPVSKRELSAALNRPDSDKNRFWLFKIQNKDLSYAETYEAGKRKSRGTQNLHSLYFLNLFKENQNVLDIGTGQIFFRKASLPLSERKKSEGHHYEELKDRFSYPIISKRRFTEDKLLFHLSLTLNYRHPQKCDLNEKVKKYIHAGGIEHVIGIDRGERNLLVASVIDLKGRIIDQKNFNTIDNGREKEINYQELLKEREGERQNARKSWQTIGKIAELKEGYLSQVVHEISKLIVEYNAIVVLENLNGEFKRGRFGVERQVYQKFERALIEKLNFLVFKDNAPNMPGGVLNAFQLTNKLKSFEKLGTQSGILFYVPAGYTSKIDPTTGFANIFNLSGLTNIKSKKDFFSKFTSIRYSAEDNAFAFEFDYENFTTYKQQFHQTKWTVFSHGKRLVWDNKQRKQKPVTPTDDIRKALSELRITNALSGENLVPAISSACENRESGPAWDKLFRAFRYTLQMRNSEPNTDIDYLISPVKNASGEFFSTEDHKPTDPLPFDTDSNGAYHIALKGLMGIRAKFAQGWQKNEAWFKFVQAREFENAD